MERDYIEMTSSLITIIVSIIAVAVFIFYGGSVLFYIIVVIAILIAAFNAWLVSNQGNLKSILDRIGKAESIATKPKPRKRPAKKQKR
ncbi:MAG: hypothetical protein QXW10_03355 [Candidatus Micrarchaeaceae archaeon]